eukprot:2374414-Amphidinium_carterae.1
MPRKGRGHLEFKGTEVTPAPNNMQLIEESVPDKCSKHQKMNWAHSKSKFLRFLPFQNAA